MAEPPGPGGKDTSTATAHAGARKDSELPAPQPTDSGPSQPSQPATLTSGNADASTLAPSAAAGAQSAAQAQPADNSDGLPISPARNPTGGNANAPNDPPVVHPNAVNNPLVVPSIPPWMRVNPDLFRLFALEFIAATSTMHKRKPRYSVIYLKASGFGTLKPKQKPKAAPLKPERKQKATPRLKKRGRPERRMGEHEEPYLSDSPEKEEGWQKLRQAVKGLKPDNKNERKALPVPPSQPQPQPNVMNVQANALNSGGANVPPSLATGQETHVGLVAQKGLGDKKSLEGKKAEFDKFESLPDPTLDPRHSSDAYALLNQKKAGTGGAAVPPSPHQHQHQRTPAIVAASTNAKNSGGANALPPRSGNNGVPTPADPTHYGGSDEDAPQGKPLIIKYDGYAGAPEDLFLKFHHEDSCISCDKVFKAWEIVAATRCEHVIHTSCFLSHRSNADNSSVYKCPKGCNPTEEQLKKNAVVAWWPWNLHTKRKLFPADPPAPHLTEELIIPAFRPRGSDLPMYAQENPPVKIIAEKPGYVYDEAQQYFNDSSRLGFVRNPQMSFTAFVCDCDQMPRPDILRLLFLGDRESQIANQAWNLMSYRRTWVSVPARYKCDRTFVRNIMESIWLPRAVDYLEGKSTNDHRLPFGMLPQTGHWYQVYANRSVLMYEAYLQADTGLYISLDDTDAQITPQVFNQRWFPKVEPWLKELHIPPALCVPISPTRWAFGTELANGLDPERKANLEKMARYETHLLIFEQWKYAMREHGRMYILSEKAIKSIESELANHLHDKQECSEVIALMRKARAVPEHVWRFVNYSRPPKRSVDLPRSPYLACKDGDFKTGAYEVHGGGACELIMFDLKLLAPMLRAVRNAEIRNCSSLQDGLLTKDVVKVGSLRAVLDDYRINDEPVGECLTKLMRILYEPEAEGSTAPSNTNRRKRHPPINPDDEYHNNGNDNKYRRVSSHRNGRGNNRNRRGRGRGGYGGGRGRGGYDRGRGRGGYGSGRGRGGYDRGRGRGGYRSGRGGYGDGHGNQGYGGGHGNQGYGGGHGHHGYGGGQGHQDYGGSYGHQDHHGRGSNGNYQGGDRRH